MKSTRLVVILGSLALFIALGGSASARSPQAPPPSGCIPGDMYDPVCDVNNDGAVNVIDMQLVGGHWGQNGVPNKPNFWSLTGNAGTDPAINFLGTLEELPVLFKTNSLERMRITERGDVGIGTDLPNARLDVRGQAPRDALAVRVDNGLAFVIAGDRQAGIGTGQPEARLQVNTGSTGEDAVKVRVMATGGGITTDPYSTEFLINGAGNVGIGTEDLLAKVSIVAGRGQDALNVRNGTIPQARITDDGRFMLGGDAIGGGANLDARLGILTFPGQRAFEVRRSHVAQPSFVIDEDENVGIGLATPPYRLTVRDNNHQIAIVDADNADKTWTLTSHQASSGVGIWENGTDARLTVAAGGNVGIGTTNPQDRLHVQDGHLRVQDGDFARVDMIATDPASDVHMIIDARGDGTNRGQIGTLSNHGLIVVTNNQPRMVIANNGDICIGAC